MNGRSYTLGGAKEHRYGFNGKEKDADGEWGSTTHYDYGARIYNPAIAKFLSVDPLTKSYPELTPYQFAHNTPVWAIDLDGLEGLTHQEVIEALTSYDPKLQHSDYTIVRATSFEPKGFSGRSLFQVYPGIRSTGGFGNVTYLREINVQGKTIMVHDGFSFGEDQETRRGYANYNNNFSVEAASFFAPGPGIYKGGKFLKSFLTNSGKTLSGVGAKQLNINLPVSGFFNSKFQQSFERAFKQVKNGLSKIDDSAVEGAIKDMHGLESNANHINKLYEALTAVKTGVATLENQIEFNKVSGAALSAAQDAVRVGKDGIKYVEDIISKATKSNVKHVQDGTLH